MNQLEPTSVGCPYCGERIDVLIDCSVLDQEYIEDCQVCCRPIRFSVSIDPSGILTVSVYHEDE